MLMSMNSEERFVGIDVDVSKTELEIGIVPGNQLWKASNDEAGRQELAERLLELDPALVVLEETGGYETPVAVHLVAEGLRVALINPHQVRDFAKHESRQVQADRINAQVLALFAQMVRPEVRPFKDQQNSELDRLFMRRRQIVEKIAAERNHLLQTTSCVDGYIQAQAEHIIGLEKNLDDVNLELKILMHHIH